MYGVPVSVERIQRAVVVLAALVCLLFVGTLSDYSPYFLLVRTLRTQPVPGTIALRDGKLVVHVIATGGAALPNARVTVLLIRDNTAYLAGYRITDNDGVVSFGNLPRGVIWVLADAEGKSRTSSQLVVGPSPRDVQLVMSPAFELTVEVVSENEKPIPGANVQVGCADPLPFLGTTNEMGLVSMGRLCRPPYTIKVSADGYEFFSRANVMPENQPLRVALRRLGWLQVSVVDQAGEPAPLSTVFVVGPSIWPARQTESNAFGRTKISGLPAGTYDLRATRGDLASPITTGVMVERGKGTPVKLILGPGRKIAVTVISGNADEAPPVPGANVVLVEEGLSSFPLQGRTGEDGVVVLGPLAPGPLTASARATGFVSAGAVLIGKDDTSVRITLLQAGKLTGEVVDNHDFPVPGCSIEVIGSDLSGLPIAETPATMAFRRAHFSWSLHGPPTLIPAGELGVMPGPIPPIPRRGFTGASSRVSHAASVDAKQLDDAITPWVTDGDGRFSVGPIPPGRISAIVRHPGYVETMSEAVTLAPGDTARVRVVLYAGGTIEGVVLDDRRYPISGVLVRITAKKGTSERSTITAEDGSFAFSAVASELILTASRPEAPDKVAFQETLQVDADDRKEMEIVLRREREAIAVHVTDDRGYPIDNARIRAISLAADVSLRRTTFSDKEGNGNVEDAAGIRLRMEVSAQGYATLVRTFDKSPEEVKLELSRGLQARGEVTTRGGRERVAGARVTVYLPTGTRELTTGEDGVYRVDDIHAGPLRLRIDHDEYVATEKTFEIAAPTDTERPVEMDAIDLEQAGIVEGEVVDDRGNPVAGAKVAKDEVPEYLPVGPLPPGVVTTNERGEFRLAGLPEGDLNLEAYAPSVGRGKEEKVTVRKGRTTTRVKIRLERNGAKSGPALTAGVALTLAPSPSGSGALVTAVVPDSEADRVGLQVGDLIIQVDGVVPKSDQDAMQRLRGPERHEVLLLIQRGQKSVEVRVPRERIRQ
ncbi:MAG: hypothetical protein CSA75_00175 [Sorangium cellulosum]|nr:MAG: hypothetical protein CSA75_00175 [Sorangium cellulosum]